MHNWISLKFIHQFSLHKQLNLLLLFNFFSHFYDQQKIIYQGEQNFSEFVAYSYKSFKLEFFRWSFVIIINCLQVYLPTYFITAFRSLMGTRAQTLLKGTFSSLRLWNTRPNRCKFTLKKENWMFTQMCVSAKYSIKCKKKQCWIVNKIF